MDHGHDHDGVHPARRALTADPIPRPDAWSVPFTETAEWFVCGPAVAASQGWKLYVPMTQLNARDILARVVPLVRDAGLAFKYVRDLDTLLWLNAGTHGYSQIGKCLVIYLPEPDGAFLESLKAALAMFRDQSPAVPCARAFGDDLPLYYRYGAYQGDAIDAGGVRIGDRRDIAVPDGIDDALAPWTTPAAGDAAVRSFLLRYPSFEAIAQQGKCGVFRALDLSSESFREVVLKVGYHRGQMQPDGSDGCAFIRREMAFYRELERRGLSGVAPRLVDAFVGPRDAILVLESIAGDDLLRMKRDGRLTVAHLEQCWTLLEHFHAAGLFLGDAKLANFIAAENGELRAIDFEAAGVAGEEAPLLRTFALRPDPPDAPGADRAHFLASVLHSYERSRSGSNRRVDLELWRDREPHDDVSAWAIGKLRHHIVTECMARVPILE